MGRPANADSSATQERIVAAARELLNELGPTAVSVRRVASRAGVSAGTLRYYFESQEELLVEASLRKYYDDLDQLKQVLFANLTDRTSARIALESAVSAAYRFSLSQTLAHELRIGSHLGGRRIGGEREAQSRLPFLREFATHLQPITGQTPEQLRFAAQSLVFLVSRYAALESSQLLDVAGVDSLEEARDHTEKYLRTCALCLLGLSQTA